VKESSRTQQFITRKISIMPIVQTVHQSEEGLVKETLVVMRMMMMMWRRRLPD
jgi:hypothetical protein